MIFRSFCHQWQVFWFFFYFKLKIIVLSECSFHVQWCWGQDRFLESKLKQNCKVEFLLADKTTCVTVPTVCRVSGHSPYSSDSDTGMGHGTPSTSGASTPNSRFFLRMHESWILTPPPCFTAGGPTSQVPMTEMENLLIEHPSMSVYNSHCSRGSSGEDSNLSESSTDSISNIVAKKGLRPRNSQGQVIRQAPRRPNAVAARCGILAQAEALKSAQRSKQRKESLHLSKGSLDRHNKTTLRHSKKFSQKNRIQTPFGRNFNTQQMKH